MPHETATFPHPPRTARATLADEVYASLVEAIASGRLGSGAVLTTVGLAQQMEVSRTPVAEALTRLAADGLIEQMPNRKARIKRFTCDEVNDIYQMRRLLEPEATARAATRLGDDTLRDLRAAFDTLAASVDDVDWSSRALAFDLDLHDTIARASGSARLYADIARYRLLVRSLCLMTGQQNNLRAAFAEHGRILDALEARHAELSRAAMTAHIDARLRGVRAAMNTLE